MLHQSSPGGRRHPCPARGRSVSAALERGGGSEEGIERLAVDLLLLLFLLVLCIPDLRLAAAATNAAAAFLLVLVLALSRALQPERASPSLLLQPEPEVLNPSLWSQSVPCGRRLMTGCEVCSLHPGRISTRFPQSGMRRGAATRWFPSYANKGPGAARRSSHRSLQTKVQIKEAEG